MTAKKLMILNRYIQELKKQHKKIGWNSKFPLEEKQYLLNSKQFKQYYRHYLLVEFISKIILFFRKLKVKLNLKRYMKTFNKYDWWGF